MHIQIGVISGVNAFDSQSHRLHGSLTILLVNPRYFRLLHDPFVRLTFLTNDSAMSMIDLSEGVVLPGRTYLGVCFGFVFNGRDCAITSHCSYMLGSMEVDHISSCRQRTCCRLHFGRCY